MLGVSPRNNTTVLHLRPQRPGLGIQPATAAVAWAFFFFCRAADPRLHSAAPWQIEAEQQVRMLGFLYFGLNILS